MQGSVIGFTVNNVIGEEISIGNQHDLLVC